MPKNIHFDTKVMTIGRLKAEIYTDISPQGESFRLFRGRENVILPYTLNMSLTDDFVIPN